MLSVVSFNVLADTYSRLIKKKSEKQHSSAELSLEDNNVTETENIFGWNSRKIKLETVLETLALKPVDIFCLQECDHFSDFYLPIFKRLNYDCVFKKRPSGKADGVLIAWKASRFTLRESVDVNFNDIGKSTDLATQKHNVATICLLDFVNEVDMAPLLVSNCHLHWQPEFSELKLMQAEHLLKEVYKIWTKVSQNGEDARILMCGDFNSKPESNVYRLMTSGQAVEKSLEGFICDPSLGKVAKFLRAIGIDCIFDDKVQGIDILKVCRQNPGRIFLTRSKSIIRRRDCPQSSILVKSQSGEDAFIQVVRETNLQLDSKKFYTICVKCNGKIVPIQRETIPLSRISFESKESYVQAKSRKKTEEPNKVPKRLYDDPTEPLAMCDGCEQIYWWDTECIGGQRKSNSSARIEDLVTKLESLAVSADFMEKNKKEMHLRSLKLLQEDRLYVSELVFQCAQSKTTSGQEEFTNITEDFKGTIDYVFYSQKHFQLIDVEYLPSQHELQGFLPNNKWPSDHRCIHCSFNLVST
mmetsp:Transcript_6567/g.7951  ORF Transcript_6567/g.7951 Transcript_6567/m.7951 type:complete len:527 (+) Transcript_6567:92-1672(+)